MVCAAWLDGSAELNGNLQELSEAGGHVGACFAHSEELHHVHIGFLDGVRVRLRVCQLGVEKKTRLH